MPWLAVLHTSEEVCHYFATRVLPVEKVLLAREGSKAVAFIAVHRGWLNHLYIAPDHWGAGLGRQLLETARAEARDLQLWVFQRNERARNFYARHGFAERERTDGQANEEKEPDIRMEWVRHS